MACSVGPFTMIGHPEIYLRVAKSLEQLEMVTLSMLVQSLLKIFLMI